MRHRDSITDCMRKASKQAKQANKTERWDRDVLVGRKIGKGGYMGKILYIDCQTGKSEWRENREAAGECMKGR